MRCAQPGLLDVRLRSPTAAGCAQAFYDPAARDAKYSGDWAQYLVDMHDARATFDFCGGMMFQLVLSDKLRSRLADAGKCSRSLCVFFEGFKEAAAQPRASASSRWCSASSG